MGIKTLADLNGRIWYRFLKVIFITAYVPSLLIAFVCATDFGKIYHPQFLPDKAIEAVMDPKFRKLDNYEKIHVLSAVDSDFAALPYDEQEKVVEKINNKDMGIIDPFDPLHIKAHQYGAQLPPGFILDTPPGAQLNGGALKPKAADEWVDGPMKPVTDPEILRQLNGDGDGDGQGKLVTDQRYWRSSTGMRVGRESS